MLVLCAFLMLQPLMYADAKLNKEIASLEIELVKMKTKTGDYAGMSDKALEKRISKTQKTLDKKKTKAKKEAQKNVEKIKKDLKKTGKDIGDSVKSIFN